MLQIKRNKKGFTLAELLIVIAIIAILIAIAIPTFSGAINKAELAADQANVRAAYAEAILAYYADGTTITADVLAAAATNGHVDGISGGTITFKDGSSIPYDTEVVTGAFGE